MKATIFKNSGKYLKSEEYSKNGSFYKCRVRGKIMINSICTNCGKIYGYHEPHTEKCVK
jgi:hypothetical protein